MKKKNLSHKKRKTPTEEDRNDTSAKTAYFQSHGKKRQRDRHREREREEVEGEERTVIRGWP